MQKLKVIIVGAGIGGLTAAIALKQAGYVVEVYDRVQELRPVGAGISLWSNGVKILNRLGLGEQIATIGGQMDRMQYRSHTGELLNDIDLNPLMTQVGQRPYPVARRDLQNILLEGFGESVNLGCECIGVEQTETSATAVFANGHRATGDLVIAADGIRSAIREYVVGRTVEPQYGGYINWNGLVTADEYLAPKNTWIVYVGEHKRASMMPVGGDRFYFFFDVPLPKGTPANPETYQAELRQHFQGWAKPVQLLIDRIDPTEVARPEIHDVGPIDRYVRDRVALLGDSAHATCPDLGQGGCQAMEDALVLANYLISTNISVKDALLRYEQERKQRANLVVQKARKRAEKIHGKEPNLTQQWYAQLAQEHPLEVTNAISEVILAGPLR
ncbi:MAG: FAD-dependent urate hydroxylase HpxO [Desertifilum sp. SIO1I2]|nr:FAD-dependent urate hydroxylase HpxO [Desertifilum sp. SIO1I2]